jgi:hypothetical protein
LAAAEHGLPDFGADFPAGVASASCVAEAAGVITGEAVAEAGTRLPVPAATRTAVAASATGPGVLRRTDRIHVLVIIDYP